MSSARTFLAIPLPEHIREAIEDLQKRLSKVARDVRWSRPETLHLTLHFFGETSQENLEKIKASMLSVKRCHQPVGIDIKGREQLSRIDVVRQVFLFCQTGRHPRIHDDGPILALQTP